MSTVRVETLEFREREQAWRWLRRTGFYAALPFIGLGIEFFRAGWQYALVGGVFLSVGAATSGAALLLYIRRRRRPACYVLIVEIAGQSRRLFSCRDHDLVWKVHDGLVKAMSLPAAASTMNFTITGGQGFQFGQGNTQRNYY